MDPVAKARAILAASKAKKQCSRGKPEYARVETTDDDGDLAKLPRASLVDNNSDLELVPVDKTPSSPARHEDVLIV